MSQPLKRKFDEATDSPGEEVPAKKARLVDSETSVGHESYHAAPSASANDKKLMAYRRAYDSTLGSLDLSPSPSGGGNHTGYGSDSGDAMEAVDSADLPLQTHWNEEFQNYFELPQRTPWERLERARKMNQVYESFVEKATMIGQTIIEEISIASYSKTIARLGHRGIAGGEKFVYDGIFFKLSTDPYKLYGGDHFAMKAAVRDVGHELKAFNELFSCPGVGSPSGLHLPMLTIVDYVGYRIIASAALPISRKTILYGSDDGCKTLHDESPELRGLISDAAEHLGLKQHMAGEGLTSSPREMLLPADVEGHRGADGRYYLLDVQRLFPSEQAFGTSMGILLPANPNDSMRVVVLDRAKYAEDISKLFGDAVEWVENVHQEYLMVSYSSYSTDKAPLNHRASDLTQTQLYGDVLCVLGEDAPSKREVLFYMLRPEWLRRNRPIRVSSDVFTKFGTHAKTEHEGEVDQLRSRLVEEQVPQFVEWLIINNHRIISSLHFPPLMHSHGINMRYIGLLYMLVPPTARRLKYNIIGFQMLARVITNHLQAKLRTREFETRESFKRTIVDFFNLVLGDGPESDSFWTNRIPVMLMLKYGPFGFVYSAKDDDFQRILGHLTLFQLLQHYTGVKFKRGAEEKFLPQNIKNRKANPLSLDDLEMLAAKRKRWRWALLPYIGDACNSSDLNPFSITDIEMNKEEDIRLVEHLCSSMVEDERTSDISIPLRRSQDVSRTSISDKKIGEVMRKIRALRVHLTLVDHIYGEFSVEKAASAFKLADSYSELGVHDRAFDTMKMGVHILIHLGEVSGEILLSSLYIIGLVFERAQVVDKALVIYKIVLEHVQELFDSEDDWTSASPMEMELTQRLFHLATVSGETDTATALGPLLEKLKTIYPAKVDGRAMVYEFFSFKNISGITLNYSNELRALLGEEEDEATTLPLTPSLSASTDRGRGPLTPNLLASSNRVIFDGPDLDAMDEDDEDEDEDEEVDEDESDAGQDELAPSQPSPRQESDGDEFVSLNPAFL